MTTVEGIAKVFYYQDVSLSCEQIRLDLAAGKVAIMPSSPDQEKTLLQLKEIIIGGHKVSISLESATKQEACLYLPVPMDAKTMVDMWLNCFGIELKEDDVETNEIAEAFIKLSTKQFNEITGQTFLLRGEQVKVLKRSSLRVKLQVPSHLNLTEAMLSAAVVQHIEQESIEELYYSKKRNEAFLHLRTTEAKARLLHLRVLSPSSAPSITTVKSPPPEQKEPLARPLNPFTRASLKLVVALPPTMNSEGISALQAFLLASDKKAFITHRNGKVYLEISDHNLYQQLLTKKHVDVLGMKIPISPFEGEVPHWVVTLVPSFPDKPKGQVSTAVIQAFTTVSPGSRVGQIEIGSDSIRVPVSNEQAFVALGRARKLFLFGTEVTVEAGRRLSDKRAIKTETLEAIQIYYLKKKRAEIKATEEQYNVTILLNTPTKPSSPKPPTRSPSYSLDNDGGYKLGTINLGGRKRNSSSKRGSSRGGRVAHSYSARHSPPGSPAKGKKPVSPTATKHKTPMGMVEIEGEKMSDVESAWETLDSILDASRQLQQQFSFDVSEEALMEIFSRQLFLTAKKSKTTALVSWRDGNKISYVLRGEAEEAQSIQGYATQLRNELVVDRTECIPPQDFYRLSQDLQKLAKEFDVNLQHCHETGQLAVAGTQDAVVACLASIRELLGATDGFLRLSMPPGKVMFFKEFALPELVRRGQLQGLKVLFPKPDQVCLKGPRDALTDLNPTLQHLINDILETRKEVSEVSGPLVPVLEAFLVQQLRGKVPARVVVFRDKSAEHSTPSIFYKNEEEEEEKIYKEEEEEDDDEAEQEGLQIIRYATVPKKDFCYRNSQPITYSRFGTARSATVTALVYHPVGSQAYVKQLLEGLAVTSSSISFTSREHPAVKRYNTALCVKRHAVWVNTNLKGRIDLRGFSAESVETVEREIRTFIDKGTVVEEEVSLTKERFQYLNAKRKEEIRSLKSQHNLFFGPKEDKSRELFTMKGFRSNVEQAKRDILRMCEKLRPPRVISLDPKKKVDRNDIKEARRELEDNYNVYINVEESRTKGFTITILGTNDKMIAEVEDEIKKLCAGPMVWKPEDPSTYTQLARLIWKEKKIDLYKFKKEWNLTWLRLDDDNKAVELRAIWLHSPLSSQSVGEQTRNTASTLQTIRLCDVKPSVVALWQADLHEEAKNLRQTCKVRTVSQLKAPEELAYQWSWRENDGTFTDFDPDQNYQIEVAYNKQQGRGKVEVTGDLLKQKNGFTYEIDFDAMTEINTKYRANPRPIKRTPKDVTSQFVWEVETSAGWEALGPMEQQQLEIAVNRNFTEVLFSWYGVQCKAIFAHNIIDANGTRYRMRRRARNLEQELLDYIEASSGDRAKDDGTQTPRLQAEERVKMVPVELIGLKTELSKGLSKFEALLQKQRSTTQLELPGELTNAHLEELERTAQRFFVTISVCKKLDGSPALQLEGPKSTLQQAKSEITPLVYKALGSHRVAFPRQWEPQTQTCVLVPIQPTGEEWQQVEKQMKITMPTVSIRSIERVQNKWLWEKYANCKAIMEKKNGGDANECLLFHGTRSAHPSCIYNGQEGFDMRVSGRQGLWGLANYFALNASYSHDYAHTTSDNLKQMFLVKVLVGDNVELQSNRALTKPPQKSTSNSLGFVEDYDSVSGHTNGSKVFMIYTLNHAYPDYLITYTLP
ncbi:hypothetical protein QOT17_018962 [Balamuthia mandrillaris]